MGTDTLIQSMSQLCSYLLPVFAVILCIFIILFFKHLIAMLKTATKTLDDTSKMINDCQRQINKLDGPLETMNELSETVDTIHDASKHAVNTTVSIVLNNLETIRDWFNKKKNHNDDNQERDEETYE